MNKTPCDGDLRPRIVTAKYSAELGKWVDEIAIEFDDMAEFRAHLAQFSGRSRDT